MFCRAKSWVNLQEMQINNRLNSVLANNQLTFMQLVSESSALHRLGLELN